MVAWAPIAASVAGGLMGGMGGGDEGGMPEWYRNFIGAQMQRAEGIADQPFQRAPNPFGAAGQLNRQLTGMGMPMMGMSRGNMQMGQDMLNRAGWRLQNMGNVGNVLGMADQFMNPYTEQVINRVGSDIKRARDALIQGEENQRLGQGTYGSARHGVADSLTNENAMRQFANTSAQLRQSGFQNALNSAMQQQGQQFNIANAMAGLGQNRMGLGMQGLGVAGDLANRQQGFADRRAAFNNQEFMRQQLWPAQMFAASGGMPGAVPQRTNSGGFNPMAAISGAMAGAGIGNQLWGGGGGQTGANPWINQLASMPGLGNFVNFG